MKKTYQNPTLEVVRIETQQMLALSGGYNPTAVGANEVDGRESDLDDDF